MKLGPVTKLDKTNKAASKKIVVAVILANCDVIIIFPIHNQSGAFQKPDFGHIACKTYIFINSNLLSYKNWKQNWKISNTALTLLLWVKVPFLLKNADFLGKNCWNQQNLEDFGTIRYIFLNYMYASVLTYQI